MATYVIAALCNVPDRQISTDDSHSQDHFRHLALIEFETDGLDATPAAVRTLDGARSAELLIPGQVMTSLYRDPTTCVAP